MTPLDDRHVLRLVPPAHPPERAEEVPHPRPQPLHRVAVHLAHAVPIGVHRPGALGTRVVHRPVDSAVPAPTRLYPFHSSVLTTVPFRHAPSMTASNSLPPAVS